MLLPLLPGVLLSLLLLSGCAGPPVILEKHGATEHDFANDQYDCSVQMNQSAGAIAYRLDPLGHLNYLGEVADAMRACLARKGWTPKQADQVAELSSAGSPP